jgi:hypothetical protein
MGAKRLERDTNHSPPLESVTLNFQARNKLSQRWLGTKSSLTMAYEDTTVIRNAIFNKHCNVCPISLIFLCTEGVTVLFKLVLQ